MDDRRIYSDQEFAFILRKATELANQADRHGHIPTGLTLTEMKAAAAEAGIDPALVERATRLLPKNVSYSRFERLIGGPLRHSSEVHVPVPLDEARAAHLLAAVQIYAGQPGNGHSSSLGMVWHTSRQEVEGLSVTAQPEEDGMSVAVHIDRTGTLAVIHVGTLIGFVVAGLAGLFVGNAVNLELGVAAGAFGMSGILAAVRYYWASSTKQVRERINGLMDSVGQVVTRSDNSPAVSGVIGHDGGLLSTDEDIQEAGVTHISDINPGRNQIRY